MLSTYRIYMIVDGQGQGVVGILDVKCRLRLCGEQTL